MATHHASIKRFTSHGFTIVELLIVVVVIAILAAIVIVAYNGITRQAAETSLKSDLRNSASQIELVKEETGNTTYPLDSAEAKLAKSQGNTVTYFTKPYGYCVSAVNTRTNKSFAVRSVDKAVTEGTCEVTVTTFAGTNATGYVDGQGGNARFSSPSGVAAAPDGTIYVSDSNNNRIRKITADGTVSFVSGSGTRGTVNGSAATAQLYAPSKLGLDESGNIYVVEGNSHTVRKVELASGTVSTHAGAFTSCNYGRGGHMDGVTGVAKLDGPSGIVFDKSGVSYITESRSNRIRSVQPDGSITTYAGSGDLFRCTAITAQSGNVDGPRLSAMFSGLSDIIYGINGKLYIADSGNGSIRTMTSYGIVETFVTGLEAPQSVRAMTMDTQGVLYVASRSLIRSIHPDGTIKTIAGNSAYGYANGSGSAARFDGVADISFSQDQTALFIADSNNHTIRKLSL